MLSSLPNDVLELIYKKKHEMEMKELMPEIENHKHNQYVKLRGLIRWYENMNLQFYEPEIIAEILSAMRNEGYLTNEQLEWELNDMESNIRYNHYDTELCVINKQECMNDVNYKQKTLM